MVFFYFIVLSAIITLTRRGVSATAGCTKSLALSIPFCLVGLGISIDAASASQATYQSNEMPSEISDQSYPTLSADQSVSSGPDQLASPNKAGDLTGAYDNFITMNLKSGPVVIQLCPNKAPNHVQRIRDLVQSNFYNGLAFHRVIDNFMVQTGDPTGTGSGNSNKPNLQAEFNSIKHVRGVVSMARTNDTNSANSQFFIMLADTPQLDSQYTAFGKVVYGMNNIDQIKKGDSRNNGTVVNPDRIVSMQLGKPKELTIETFACE